MKFVQYFSLISMLLLQACSFETPLLKNDAPEDPQSATIIYTTYLDNVPSADKGLIFNGPGKLYLSNLWVSGKHFLKATEYNHISADSVKQHYVVTRIKPGTYIFTYYSGYHSYSSGNYRYTLTYTSPQYSAKFYPLYFTVKAGEVKYLGDIELTLSKTEHGKAIPIYKVHNNIADAKRFMQEKYPAYADKLVEGLVQKTDQQRLVEQEYSKAENKGLLKDVENAK